MHFTIFCRTTKISLLVSGCGVVGWTVTVVDSLTDKEVSVTTDDDVEDPLIMTC